MTATDPTHGHSRHQPPRRRRPLPGPPAPREAEDPAPHRLLAAGVRGGRGGAPARLHQRGRARPPPHAVEPLRTLRPPDRGPDRLPSAAPLRVLGPRRLPGAGVALPGLAPGDARLLPAQSGLGHAGSGGTAASCGRSRTRSPRSGPMGSADFEHRRAPGSAGGWWNWKPAAHALDFLWMSGRTLVHSRPHFQKRFDLAERVMPEALAREPLTREGFRRWHLRQSLRAMGAASEADLRMYLTYPRTAAGDRRRALRAALDAGEVVEVEVAGRARPLAGARRGPARPGRRRPQAPPPPAPPCSRPSTRSSGTATARVACSATTTRWRSTRRATGGCTATTRCRSSTTASSSAGSIPRPTAPRGGSRSRPSTSSRGSRRGGPPAASWGAVDRDAALAGIGEALRSLAAFVGAEDVTVGRVTPAALAPALRRAVKNSA